MTDNRMPWLESYPKDVPSQINTHQFENLAEFFEQICSEYADKTAFVSFGCGLTFNEVRIKVHALASFLRAGLNLRRGDRLAVILPNLIQYPITVFACLLCGIEVVNINPLYTPHEILGVLRDCKAKAVVVLENNALALEKIKDQTYIEHVVVTKLGDCLSLFKSVAVNFGFKYLKKQVPVYDKTKILYFNDCIKAGLGKEPYKAEIAYDDIAFLQYTGGTTGKPKGAMLSHGNILANIAQAFGCYGPVLKRGGETILTALPLYHIFAMTVNLMFAFYLGCKNILIVDPRKIEDIIIRLKHNPDVSLITGVNTLFNAFVHYDLFKKVKLPRLRLVIGGGTAVQSGVADRFFKASGLHILEGYGLTECSPLCCVNPYTVKDYNGTIGLPVPSTKARIVDTSNGDEIWKIGVPGELEFKGPQVMKGYFDNEKETLNVMDDGWLKTGDVAQWCQGGYIKIIDRIKDMIIVSGFNVFPSEIEDVVSNNAKVLECAAVGMPSKQSGESIKLYVVKKDQSLTKDELLSYCRDYLTGYKIPKHIEFVDCLPKSPVGKVMRRYLKQNRLS